MTTRQRQFAAGFTLVELMVALLVSSVVLSAVATLAYATTSASTATDQIGREQSVLRHVTVRLSDLIMRANEVVSASDSGFELWHDTNTDGVPDANELTLVTRGSDGNTITIDETETDITIDEPESYRQCKNVLFQYDVSVPGTQFIAIWFDLEENGQTQRHTVTARLRGGGF